MQQQIAPFKGDKFTILTLFNPTSSPPQYQTWLQPSIDFDMEQIPSEVIIDDSDNSILIENGDKSIESAKQMHEHYCQQARLYGLSLPNWSFIIPIQSEPSGSFDLSKKIEI